MGNKTKEVIPEQQRSGLPPSSSKTAMARVQSWIFKLAFVFSIAHLVAASWSPAASTTLHGHANAALPDLYEASVTELQAGLDTGSFTSVELVKAYFKRIEEVNEQRAGLRAVLETNPLALFQAQALDEERAFFGPRGPLHGIPVLVKDNIGTLSGEGEFIEGSTMLISICSTCLIQV
jgi:amidase